VVQEDHMALAKQRATWNNVISWPRQNYSRP